MLFYLGLCQATHSPVYVLVVVILNIVTDLYLLSIPLPLLWKVNISLKRKLPLMALFSGAAFVIAAAIIRAVTISTVSFPADKTICHTSRASILTKSIGRYGRCRFWVSVGLS